MPTNPRKPREWPTKAAGVADDLMAALLTNKSDGAGVARQAKAIQRLADAGIEQIDGGNIFLTRRLLVDISKFANALSGVGDGIDNRAGKAAAALAAARVGEYGEG
jgi:hypothetical protein